MKDFYFVAPLNKITRVTAVDEDDAWRLYINYYYHHRQSSLFKESLADTRKDLENYIYAVPADEIKHIHVF